VTGPPAALVDEVVGRFAGASNLTLLARSGGRLVVYKPTAGIRPLWDFDPVTLAAREVLAFRVSEAMGLGVVPETSFADGPLGPGAVQRFIEQAAPSAPIDLIATADESLWPVALLDLVLNNADRKAGHLLLEAGTGRLWAIDQGLTFHPEAKLRTVLWGFAGRRVPRALLPSLDRLRAMLDSGLSEEVASSLGEAEAAALEGRADALWHRPVHPRPPPDRHPLPWPPY